MILAIIAIAATTRITLFTKQQINNNSKKAINNNHNRMSVEEVQMKAHSS